MDRDSLEAAFAQGRQHRRRTRWRRALIVIGLLAVSALLTAALYPWLASAVGLAS